MEEVMYYFFWLVINYQNKEKEVIKFCFNWNFGKCAKAMLY